MQIHYGPRALLKVRKANLEMQVIDARDAAVSPRLVQWRLQGS